MKKLFFAIAALLCGLSVWANDGVYYVSGNHLVPLMETDISVRKEVLTISLMDNGYARVDVYYEFWNPSPKERRLLMGFEANAPYNHDWTFYPDGVHPFINDFLVEMNGKRLGYKNAACVAGKGKLDKIDVSKTYEVFENNLIYEKGKNPEQGGDIEQGIDVAYVYYFDAYFTPGLNKVHHTYTYKMSVVVGQTFVLDYKLSPAARWANHQIDDFTLVLRVDSTAKHFTMPSGIFPNAKFQVTEGTGKVRLVKGEQNNDLGYDHYEFSLRKAAVRLNIKNFVPEQELSLASPYSWNNPKLGYTYDRSSSVALRQMQFGDKVNPADPAFFRRVARNLPFANRGHVFKDEKLKKYFESLWWYMPDPEYKDDTSDFTDVDWEYAKFDGFKEEE